MVTHTQNSCSTFYPSKCTHTHSREHTNTVNTHPEQGTAIYAAAPGVQLRGQCLAQGHLSHGIDGGERVLYIHLAPPTIPAGPRLEVTTFRLWVRLSNISRELISINTTSPRNRGWCLATRTFSSPHRFSMGFWRLARPLQDLNVLLLEPLLCCLGCVFWVIVMLEYPSTTHFQCPGRF